MPEIRVHDLSHAQGPYRELLPRGQFDAGAAVEAVAPILEDVAERGQEALRDYSMRFDGVVPENFRVPEAELVRAAEGLDAQLRSAFEEAIGRRRRVAEDLEIQLETATTEVAPGARIEVRSIPVDRVGLYVPGGLAPLASSVIMNVVPAQVAGVGSIAVASPPQRECGGWPHPSILALCHLLGVGEVYAVGGAQAIAMFAHGLEALCDPVSMITGPGNVYVVAAKRLVRGLVGIDTEAGPTEIAVLADETARPELIAADLISQAEHDPLAASVLITPSRRLVDEVQRLVVAQVADTKHAGRIRTALGGTQSGIVLVRDMEQGIDVANAYGAEHLEIHTADPREVAARIRNAGAIFVGESSPVSLGDYSAGSTHVLPTAGCACHSSGLTTRSFLRTVHVVDYSADALEAVADGVERFAHAEDLPGHANAIAVRRRG